jgi:superoxide reductase
MRIGDRIQSADWKTEKHVPAIDCPDKVEAGKPFAVKLEVGKEIQHPNTQEHHIRWIELYFSPEGSKFAFLVGRAEFDAHGEGATFTQPAAKLWISVDGPGTLTALSLCNLHGLWESSTELAI